MGQDNAVPAGFEPHGDPRGIARSRRCSLRYARTMRTHRGRRSCLGFACVLAAACATAAAPIRGAAAAPSPLRPDEDAANRGFELLGAGDSRLAAGDQAGAADAYAAAADEFLGAADLLRGRSGDLLDIRSDHVILALRLQQQAHMAVPRSPEQLREVHRRTTAALAELEQLQADASGLATIRELLAQLPADTPVPAPAPEPAIPRTEDEPQDTTRGAPAPSHRGLAVGLGVSAGSLGLSAVLVGVGYTEVVRTHDAVQTAVDAAVNDEGVVVDDEEDLCSARLRKMDSVGVDELCKSHTGWNSITIASSVGLGVSAAATVVFAVLLARARRGSSPRRGLPTATALTPMRGGGVMLGGTWQF
jgi:hypothetical protein